ncbi:hypothetical protein GQ53DRAFT_30441 [Thozetella sp. PMI_491]|nr:hypothetical protein GQ53DRAFT_30441 [Thozetella sp. PMI_491]
MAYNVDQRDLAGLYLQPGQTFTAASPRDATRFDADSARTKGGWSCTDHKCPEFGNVFKMKKDLERHWREASYHSTSCYYCTCGRQEARRYRILQHLDGCHVDSHMAYVCNCGRAFDTSSSFSEHVQACQKRKPGRPRSHK